MLCIFAVDQRNEFFKAWCNLLNAAFRVDWIEADYRKIARLPHVKGQ